MAVVGVVKARNRYVVGDSKSVGTESGNGCGSHYVVGTYYGTGHIWKILDEVFHRCLSRGSTEVAVVNGFLAYIQSVLTKNAAESSKPVRALGILGRPRDIGKIPIAVGVYHVLGYAAHGCLIIYADMIKAGDILVYADCGYACKLYFFDYVIYSFLLVAGYLRVTGTIGAIGGNPICSLSIPNREIKSVFQKEILNLYSAVFTGSLLRDFEVSVRTGNSELLTETLQKYLLQSASVYDTAYESFYHGTVFGMLAVMSDSYYITSNRESGEGRFDVQLEPHDKSRTGFILEFKTKKDLDEAGLKALAAEGIEQIRDHQYYTDMEYHGISNIIFFGIGFSGKKVAVTVEKK